MDVIKLIILSAIIGALAGGAVGYVVAGQLANRPASQNELIRDFYLTETAVHVSPHSLRKMMDKGEKSFVLVDLRSKEEYDVEHIIGAINIPAYKDKDTSAYDEVDRIVGEFAKLPKNKDVIVYCYSMPCMTGRKIGKMLVEHGIYVKHLGIGWNEWRYFWTLWNHEGEWNSTNATDYIWQGPEPGVPKTNHNSSACSVGGGEFGC